MIQNQSLKNQLNTFSLDEESKVTAWFNFDKMYFLFFYLYIY